LWLDNDMTTTSADYIHFLNGSQVGPTFTSVTAAHEWAKANRPVGDLYELAVVRNGEFEVM
jgi:hypothetical protein